MSNKTLNQSLCTLRFENKKEQNLLNKKCGPGLLVPVSAFSSEKNKSTRNSAENIEAEKNQSERLKRQNELPETGLKKILIKEEEDEFDVFCRSLALQLKSMPFDRARKCQEKLQAVISAELDQLDAPSSPKCWIQVEIPPSTSITPPEPLIDIKVEPAELP
ncbi:uncharacterized protein LOC121734907 [Aricia agestis]|uniref:uncharacterized protein LOC121734907 n=1 Tax=Aricia agestis TaxID=91739 RepID=UPI001C201FFD|nr:uncharacterized protein LOC121734907 [Aricia agestis]